MERDANGRVVRERLSGNYASSDGTVRIEYQYVSN